MKPLRSHHRRLSLQHLALLGCLANAGCEHGEPSGGALASSTPATDIRVQEFGLLSWFADRDGLAVGGLHHTEAVLPPFVAKPGVGPQQVGKTVAVRLDGQALLIRSAAMAGSVELELAWPDGVWVANWPIATTVLPATSGLTAWQGASAKWSLVVGDTEPSASEATPEWQALRSGKGLELRDQIHQSMREQFVAVRGWGERQPPVRAVWSGDDLFWTATLHNDSDEVLPAAFFVHVHDAGGLLKPLGSVPAHGSVVASPTPKESNPALFAEASRSALFTALTTAGLDKQAANAALDAWGESAFKTPGMRVLWILPPALTASWLPITVAPTPLDHARVYVARTELASPLEDQALLADLRTPLIPESILAKWGVFAEPRLRRACALPEAADLKQRCDALLKLSANAP